MTKSLIRREELAFKKNIPSVFAVCSPFQVLCAVEAIREFEIKDYIFYVLFLENEKKRINQTLGILETFDIKYNVVDFTHDWSKGRLLKALIPRHNKYKRAFIGHFRIDYLFHAAFSSISNNSVVVYLDDGTNCLTLLDNSFSFKKTNNHKIIKWASKLRNITYHKHLFTIYYDYDIRNTDLRIYKNSLHNICQSKNFEQVNSAFIVGTAIDDYCKTTGITVKKYIICMKSILKDLLTNYDNIYYFPHGRDDNKEIKQLCERYSIQYIRPSSTIEMYMFNSDNLPKVVYGFSSSALFNIKLFFPQLRVFNFMYLYNTYNGYKDIALYYEKHDIKTIYYQ